ALMSGRSCGSENRRTRRMLSADPSDDIVFVVNLSGPHRVRHDGQEFVLGDGDATMASFEEVCSFTHRAPGGLLTLRVPRWPLAQLITSIDDRCFRPIPRATPALGLLVDYVKAAQDGGRLTSAALRQLVVSHIYDLIATVVAAPCDGAGRAGLHAA